MNCVKSGSGSGSGSGSAVELAKNVKQESFKLSSLSNEIKNKILLFIQKALEKNKVRILYENALDLKDAESAVNEGSLEGSLLKRLDLSIPGKWESMVNGIADIANMHDPVGIVDLARQLDDGLELYRVTCPVGVLLIIFEARPEVVIQISCLAIKSGNAVLLKGGKEAARSNKILHEAVLEGVALAENSGLKNVVGLVESRAAVDSLLKMEQYVDLVIPRGSNALVRYIKDNTRIPVMGHADGICSVYIDPSASVDMCIKIIVDGKTNYPAACNATEKVLIHSSLLQTHLVPLIQALLECKVTLKLDEECLEIAKSRLGESSLLHLATALDFQSEFLDYTLAIKSVSDLSEAIAEINTLGSHHTDCIVTANPANAETFMQAVDSAGVYWNASTRFADGFRYGFGAEIGVATGKTHARGPVGLEGLLIYKYRIYGHGQCVAEYGPAGTRSWNRMELVPKALPRFDT